MCFKSSTHYELNTNVNEPLVGKTNERHSANRAVLSITLFSVSFLSHTLSFSFIKAFSVQTFHSNQTLNKTSADMRLTLTDGQLLL